MKKSKEIREINDKILKDSVSSYNAMLCQFVKEMVCTYYGVNSEALKQNSRKKEMVKCKQISMYLIKKHSNMSLESIGKEFGKNHATVIYSIKTISNYLEWDRDLVNEVDELEKIVILKSNAMINNFSIDKNFYYIDLNAFTSIKIDENKAILFAGYSEDEVNTIVEVLKIKANYKRHTNKGMYILEKNEE